MILSSPLFITLIINLFINSRHDLNIISLICARSFVAILQNIAMFFLDHMLYNQGSYRKHNLCTIQRISHPFLYYYNNHKKTFPNNLGNKKRLRRISLMFAYLCGNPKSNGIRKNLEKNQPALGFDISQKRRSCVNSTLQLNCSE